MNRFVRSTGLFVILTALVAISAAQNLPQQQQQQQQHQLPYCDAANSWQLYPDPTNCANFYRCEYNGYYQAVLHTCVENLHYDHELRACNWDDKVICNANSNNDFQPQPQPERPSTVLTCPPAEDNQRPTHLNHPTDCGKFYKCWDGEPVLMDCPDNTIWNPTVLYCDFPKNVRCVDGFRPVEV